MPVHALDDVDFPVIRPVGSDGPEGGPDTTDIAGHVLEVQQDQGVVVDGLGGDTDGFSTSSGADGC